ncbi:MULTISPECIES: hypothetical protein [Acetobacter]|uniref:Uncharacterized protein n=2 Tax=Acetobacter TaxID=434 RepID=A0AAN1UA04_9PROT|nr:MULTISPECIES: hypothetical protein [Acetobacter]ASL39293.1 hypothetical protein CBI36_01760 [Acetobacter oryzifermentans]AXN01420.1 hypothetical protein CJF59_13325 [Acetobacter pomorum]KAA8397187.1 hypothetical protein FKW22_05310 [Acetobacter sp. DmW_125124]KAA8397733.1 hypothetical protein FKW20_08740 [Acetobacter sp. DmW_125127]KAA8401136.1 hypothetical protein FKW19_00555 [Acetobacter sp. DmW_125128]
MTDTVEQTAPKKYELTDETTTSWDGRTLHRIRALVAIASIGVAAGDLGGFIETETNLEQSGNAWVYGDARVFGDAWVSLSIHVGWFSNVGSENGTLTYFRTKDGGIYTDHVCFDGTLDEFESAVKKRHGDTQIGKEYALLIEFIRLRATSWQDVEQEAA